MTKRDATPGLSRDAIIEAVRRLYYAGVWECSRLSEEAQRGLWEAVRDACGFPPGGSPK
jgi:hypothetical protein